MASKYARQLPPTKITQNFRQGDTDVGDYGAYRILEVDIRVLKSGAAGNVSLEHSATGEPDSWRTLSATTTALTGAGQYVTVSNFLRKVRAAGDASADGTAIALVDIVAKE
jgi:hypothetical protein